MILVKGTCEGHARNSHFVMCNFGSPAQKIYLHAYQFHGTHRFVDRKYQVAFGLYHIWLWLHVKCFVTEVQRDKAVKT